MEVLQGDVPHDGRLGQSLYGGDCEAGGGVHEGAAHPHAGGGQGGRHQLDVNQPF